MDSFDEVDETLKAKKDRKKENEITYSLDAPGTIDVLDVGEKLVYLAGNLDLVDTIKDEDRIYAPPPKGSIPYLIANADRVLQYITEYEDNPQYGLDLYEELLVYHKNISDLPHEDYYDLVVLWDFHTYLLDKLHFSPIIYLYAVKERGKSRTGKGCIYVSRRGVWTETVREADIIRWGNDHKAALGFDVKDAPKKFERANCDDLILARFEKGSTSSRTLWPEKGAFKDTKTFNLFGPTIIATNRPVDDILESRSISVDMKPTSRFFNKPVVPEDALELKCKLAAWRVVYCKKELVDVKKPAPGRLGDIVSPLYSILLTFFPEKEKTFLRLLRKIELQKKDEATDTIEAKLIEAVAGMEMQVEGGFLATATIANKFNEGKNERLSLSEDTIGKILKGLGFAKRRNAGARGIYYDPELTAKLRLQYGLDDTSDTNDDDPDIPNNDNGQASDDNGGHESASHESQASLTSNQNINELNPDEQLALGKEVFGEGAHWHND